MGLFQVTISVDDANMVRYLATIYEIMVKGEDAFAVPDVISATDWYLNQLYFGISENLSYFDDDDLLRLAGYLRRTADQIEGFVDAVEDEKEEP